MSTDHTPAAGGRARPTREPYRGCCGTTLDSPHQLACAHFRRTPHSHGEQCPSCEMVGFHAAGCVEMTGTDPVSRPKHYQHSSGIETIRVNRCMTFSAGSAFKYVLRYEDKADPAEDLKKARWYVADLWGNGNQIWISTDAQAIGTPLLETMMDAESNALRWRFFDAILHYDITAMGDAVDDMRTGWAIYERWRTEARLREPLSGHVWAGDPPPTAATPTSWKDPWTEERLRDSGRSGS